MHTIEVGMPYSYGKTWPDGVVDYNAFADGHQLRLFYNTLTAEEVAAVQTGTIELGLLVRQPVIFLVFTITYQDTTYQDTNHLDVPFNGDAPYSIHLVPEEYRHVEPIGANTDQRYLLQLLLIEANTGILKALKGVSLSNDFSYALYAAIQEQKAIPFDTTDYFATIQQCYEKYPTTDAMFRECRVTCRGGE